MGMVIAPSRFAAPVAAGPGISDQWRVRIVRMQSDQTTDPQISRLEMMSTVGGSDICTGGTPIASTVWGTGFEADKAFDGDSGTRWVGGTPGVSSSYSSLPWLGYQFASPVSIAQIALTSHDFPNSMPIALTLEYWDGQAWIVHALINTAAWSGTRQRQLLTITPFATPDDLPHRYWQIFVLQNVDFNIWVGAAEVEMAETLGGADVTSTSYGFGGGSPPAVDGGHNNAFDNNTGTVWQYSNGGANGKWHYGRFIGQDFGAGNPKNIREVRLLPNVGATGTTPGLFLVRYSDDGVNYTTKFQGENYAGYAVGVYRAFNKAGIYFTSDVGIGGVPGTGNVLTPNFTHMPADATITYVYKRNGVVISGATGSTYTQVAEDDNSVFSVEVTISKNGQSVTKTARRGLKGATGATSTRWRLRSLTSSYLALSDVEFRDTAGGTDQTTGGTASASSLLNAGFPAANAFDNSTSTIYHSASGGDHWLEYQKASAYPVNEVVIRCRTDDTQMWQPSALRLEYWDGAAWQLKIEFNVSGWVQGASFTYDTRSDDQRVEGPEMLIDPSFDDASKYTASGGWSVTGGNAVATSAANELLISTAGFATPFTLGARYKITFPYSGRSGGNLRIRGGTNGTVYRNISSAELGASGTVSFGFNPNSTDLNFQADALVINITIPSMSIKELV